MTQKHTRKMESRKSTEKNNVLENEQSDEEDAEWMDLADTESEEKSSDSDTETTSGTNWFLEQEQMSSSARLAEQAQASIL